MLLREAVEGFRCALGDAPPQTVSSTLNILAAPLIARGKHVEARALLQQLPRIPSSK